MTFEIDVDLAQFVLGVCWTGKSCVYGVPDDTLVILIGPIAIYLGFGE